MEEEGSSTETEWNNLPYNQWAESHVSSWLKFIGIKEAYIQKLEEEETTGPLLISLDRDYLGNTIGMKGSQIQHLLKKIDELLKSEPNKQTFNTRTVNKESKSTSESRKESIPSPVKPCEVTESENSHTESNDMSTLTGASLSFSDHRKFDEDEKEFKYVKHSVLQPETGIENMIVPCHEYKSLEIAHKLDSTRLKTKVASEVLRFACGCMNMRTNGTIHFGIMDKVKGKHKHGEIIGIPVNNLEDFVDALDYIESERCFKGSNQQNDVRRCIKNPKFIEVVDKDANEKTWVIEYDIVPKASIVKDKLFRVGVPKFDEKQKKVKFEDKVPYQRIGANTPCVPEDDLVCFIQALKDKDLQREEAESSINQTTVDYREDQQRKLSILLTSGKKYIDNSQCYILVTNKFQPKDLDSTSFLAQMNLFCVFDFDPDSKTSGLCGRYKEHHAANLHFPHDYANIDGLGTSDNLINHLELFERTSWIFCNGRNDFRGGQKPCDEKAWIKTRKKELKKAVSVICNDILPKHSFIVMFLLMSHVEQPIVEAFHEFYAEMNGLDDLAVIAESIEIYKKWSSLAQVSCDMAALKEISVVEMPLSHVDATVQSIQLSKNQHTRRLPVFNGGLCFLKSVEEDMMNSLEIISADQCDDKKLDSMDHDEINRIEKYFYRGGKLDWINLWLADKQLCGDILQRDAYKEANTILENIYHSKAIRPTESVNIYHHPSSGGSTVARQLLWSWRTKVRCAVVKQSKAITTVCEQAMELREYEERDKNNCLPVLLLLEDCNADYIDDLRRLFGNIIATRKISPSVLCFILLICKRSNDSERMCRVSSSQTVAVIHKLSERERLLVSKTKELLNQKNYETEHILTFVLMNEEFRPEFIEDFVKKVFLEVDHSSPTTRLIRFVSLLNCYVHDSFIPVSHCELILGIASFVDRVRYQAFVEHLSAEARLIFNHLRDSSTHINSIQIILPVLAKEILIHLSVNLPQSEIAMDLIKDRVLLNNRFGREEFLTFIRALFIRRNKRSRGDAKDTTFSPLIEHIVTERDGVQKAVNLMEAAYISLGKDPFVAQQLARLLYTNKRFEEALKWAEDAKSSVPHDTFVLDTLGQVYKRWFYHLHDTLEEKEVPTPESAIEIIHIALKGISAFRASEQTLKKDNVSLNNSYYGEVDVGCRLLKFLSMVDVLSGNGGNSDLMRYLLTDYIPIDVKKPWHKFHHQLKGLHKSLYNALEYISEDLSYFQTDISEEDEELDAREPEQVHSPREWLTRKSTAFAAFFCNVQNTEMASPAENMTLFQRQMKTYELGGGNTTSILSLLYDPKPERSVKKLEGIIGMYPENLRTDDLDKTELINFIFCQIALNCISPGSSKLLSLQKLQRLCMKFNRDGRNTSASALFLLSMLFWPETNDDLISGNIKILVSAIDTLQRIFDQKIEHTCPRKSRIVTHFYLAKARGLNKIVHRTAIEKHIKGPVSERKLKWLGGEVWKTKEFVQTLRRVEGWTENDKLFIKGADRDSKIRIFPRYSASLPNANENVTFYLGFTFNGVLAFDIQVME